MSQMNLFDDDAERRLPDEAHARKTHPWTSHAAAKSITPEQLRETQRAVYDCFLVNGAMHHQRLVVVYDQDRLVTGWPPQEDSGLRTRTSELVKAGLVKDTGEIVMIGKGKRKHPSKVWDIA